MAMRMGSSLRLRSIVASRLGEAGPIRFECSRRNTGTVALRATLQEVARTFGDVLRREVQVLVDIHVGRRGTKSIETDDLAFQAHPALPAQWCGRLDGHA